MKKLKLYYCKGDNFGDALNEYIFEKCFGVKVEYADSWDADAIGIGSIMDRCLLQIRDIPMYILNKIVNFKKPLNVLSSGFGIDNSYYKKKPRFLKSTILKRKLNIISLRGKLSKAQLETILGMREGNRISPVLGDLGLLADKLVYENQSEPIYDIGICPHYADKNHEFIQKVLENNPNSIILDTSDNPIEYIKKMKQCKTILSTGLHPLIVADSLGIPNLWGRVSDATTIYKYKDYYSVLGVEPEPLYLAGKQISPELIINKYQIKKENVEKVKKDLFEAHKKFFDELS